MFYDPKYHLFCQMLHLNLKRMCCYSFVECFMNVNLVDNAIQVFYILTDFLSLGSILSIIQRMILKSATVLVNLSIPPGSSISFCCFCFEAHY